LVLFPLCLRIFSNKIGHPCGLGEQNGFPNIYFLKHKGVIQANSTTCVKECPSTTTSTLQCAPDFMKSGEECSKQEVYPTFTCKISLDY